MLCFNKLTREYNTEKIIFKNFVLWEYIFKTVLKTGLKLFSIFLLGLIQQFLNAQKDISYRK